MDHYEILGVHKNSSKDEIKQAFRKLAMEFHPDKHSQSSKYLRDSATVKFKQLTEAYETLSDDRKRADYNLKRNSHGARYRRYKNQYRGGGGDGAYTNSYGYGYGGRGSRMKTGGGDMFTKFEMGLRYLTTRSFLLNATFVGILFGGMYALDEGGKTLWKMHNPGKSFEEAMESIEKSKELKKDSC